LDAVRVEYISSLKIWIRSCRPRSGRGPLDGDVAPTGWRPRKLRAERRADDGDSAAALPVVLVRPRPEAIAVHVAPYSGVRPVTNIRSIPGVLTDERFVAGEEGEDLRVLDREPGEVLVPEARRHREALLLSSSGLFAWRTPCVPPMPSNRPTLSRTPSRPTS